jgi:hypothetical protein
MFLLYVLTIIEQYLIHWVNPTQIINWNRCEISKFFQELSLLLFKYNVFYRSNFLKEELMGQKLEALTVKIVKRKWRMMVFCGPPDREAPNDAPFR